MKPQIIECHNIYCRSKLILILFFLLCVISIFLNNKYKDEIIKNSNLNTIKIIKEIKRTEHKILNEIFNERKDK